MQINYLTKHIELEEYVSQEIEKKLAKFEKFADDSTLMDVTIEGDLPKKGVQVNLHYTDATHSFYASEEAKDVLTAFNAAKEELFTEITRVKGKEQDQSRNKARQAKKTLRQSF